MFSFSSLRNRRRQAPRKGRAALTFRPGLEALEARDLPSGMGPPAFGPPDHLLIAPVADTSAGSAIAPAVTVQVVDKMGNRVLNDISTVTVALGMNPDSGVLHGTLSEPAVGGQATFTDLSINQASGGYTLTASDGSLGGAQSNTFTVAPGMPARLAFTVPPVNANTGQSLGPVTVQVEDTFGNPEPADANTLIALAIGTTTGSGTLNGTTSAFDAGGVAVFNHLSVSRPGTYTLTAVATGLTGDTSASFTVATPPETEPNDTPAVANSIGDNATIAGTISTADTDFYQLTLTSTEQITALLSAGGAPVQLSLLHSDGSLVIQSAGISPSDAGAQVVQILTPGTWYLEVNSPGATASAYTLSTTGVAALPTSQPLAPVASPGNLITADFNNDGIADLATVSATQGTAMVYLGLGDGAFQPPAPVPVSGTPVAVAASDFNGDGALDLAVLSQQGSSNPDTVTVLLNESGVFMPAGSTSTGGMGGNALVVANFDGTNRPDVAVVNEVSGTVSVLLNDGTGRLSTPIITSGTAAAPLSSPTDLAAGDFNGDHRIDLAVTTGDQKGAVAILLGSGDGTFSVQPTGYHVGRQVLGGFSSPAAVVASDLNGDGALDLATANFGSADVSVLYGNGDGSFQAPLNVAAGTAPVTLTVANISGRPDLVAANAVSNEADILENTGAGFTLTQTVALGGGPVSLAAADFNGDGRTDLASVNAGTSDITIKTQNPDGTFASPALHVGGAPLVLAAADVNNDGALDIVTLNQATGNLSMLLGDGSGSFSAGTAVAVTGTPVALATGDFNGDSRTDLVVLSYQLDATTHDLTGTLTVLLGYGDGSFQVVPVMTFPHEAAASLAVGDFNHDGHADLAVVYQLEVPAGGGKHTTQGTCVAILDGQGDGTFQAEATVYVLSATDSLSSYKILANDLNGDGWLDLVVLNSTSGTATALPNTSGTFVIGPAVAAGTNVTDMLIADLNGDGKPDVAVLDAGSPSQLTLLPGNGDGTFGIPQAAALAFGDAQDQLTFAAGDFQVANGQGPLSLAVADYSTDRLYILDNSGTGAFTAEAGYYMTGDGPLAPVVGDFNNDNYADIALVDQRIGDVSVFLNQRGTGFAPAGEAAVAQQTTPLLGDINGDGVADVVVRASNGAVLFRPGLAGAPGTFGAAMLVNGTPGNPPQLTQVRDVALVHTATGTAIAAVNDVGDVLATYTWQPGGGFAVQPGPMVGPLVTALAAADLNGDGLTDLVVTNSTNTAEILIQQADGSFQVLATPTLDAGFLPSSITFVSNASGGPDIAITGEISGDVTVIRTDGGRFDQVQRFRAGQGPYDIVQAPQGLGMVDSPEGTAGAVTGNFGSPSGRDLVTINPGTGSLDLLTGTGFGTYDNPQQLTSVVSDPTAIVGGTLTPQTGAPSFFAVLSSTTDTVSVFLPNGSGGFTEVLSPNVNGTLGPLDAGNYPTGLAAADVNGDGKTDLLVGNSYGDVLVLYGNGDGTFQTFQSSGRNTSLAATDLTGGGQDSFLVSNESASTLSLQSAPAGASFSQGRGNGVIAPGAVQFADLNGDGIKDLIAVNGGGNDILVYLGLGSGQFGPAQTFAVGDAPAGLTLFDLNGDGLPDVIVANQGSNDVSILLSSGSGASWTLTTGARLHAGAGPVATAVVDVNGDGIPDLLVSDSLSDTLTVLPGVGGGFFRDAAARIFDTGPTPGQVLVGNFDGRGLDVIVLNTGASTLTFFSRFSTGLSATSGTTLSAGGSAPTAATSGDFNGDGLDDLLVVNNGSDTITLLMATSAGPELARTFTTAALVNPTDVALSTNGTAFYVTEEDSNQVFTFSLESENAPVPAMLDESGVAVLSVPLAESPAATTELVSVGSSPFESVAVLVNAPSETTTAPNPALLVLERSAEEALPFAAETEALAARTGAAVELAVQADAGPEGGGGGTGEGDAKPADDAAVPMRDGPELLRFLQNLDLPRPADTSPQPPAPAQQGAPPQETWDDLLDQAVRRWAAPASAAPAEAVPMELVRLPQATPVVIAMTERVFVPACAVIPATPLADHVPTIIAARTGTHAEPGNSGPQLSVLAAPLLAAYFAREPRADRSRPAHVRWLPW